MPWRQVQLFVGDIAVRMVCDINVLSRCRPITNLNLVGATNACIWGYHDIVSKNNLRGECLFAILPLIDGYEFRVVSQCYTLSYMDMFATDEMHGCSIDYQIFSTYKEVLEICCIAFVSQIMPYEYNPFWSQSS